MTNFAISHFQPDREFMIDGLGQLLFNTYKGLNGMLHGGTSQVINP